MRIIIKLLAFVLLFYSARLLEAQEIDFSFMDHNLSIEERTEILVSQMTTEEKISQLMSNAAAIPRLMVPDYVWWSEALHGIARNGKATVFPQAIGMGATFDTELVNKVASAISSEARAKYTIAQEMGNHSKYAGLTFWSPTVNLFRDPRYGRGQECYGEDPFLMSKMGVAFVQGMQGDNPNYIKAAACAKHYVMHSGPELNKMSFNIKPSKQDLYESYLPAFHALVTEAKVEGVMTAYNMALGYPMAMNKELVSGILLADWKFDGYITSDCGAIHGVSGKDKFFSTAYEGAAEALKTGLTLNCGSAFKQLKKALDEGLITEELIHERTCQLFKTRFRLGMFDKAGDNPYLSFGPEVIHCDEHVALSREAAQKSIVLLKNKNNVLPIPKDIKVPYVTGPFANSVDMLMGSYYGVSSGFVTILEGITEAVSLGTSLNYRSGALPFHKNLNPRNFAPFVAAQSDVTICVVGITADMEGEGVDAIASAHHGDREDLKLPENQVNYIHQLLEKNKGPFVLVIASGSPVSLEGIEEHCDAILQIWYPGEQGGNAVADILFGEVSPSGHLPVTFPKSVDQLPPYSDYSMKGRTYKYMTEEPMYPFGFGLTYSKTEFSKLKLSSSTIRKKEGLDILVEVTNTGDYYIEEVVQLYICPVDTSGNLPLKSLKSFKRVPLDKGDTKTVSFSLNPEDLKVTNEGGERVWRKGQYEIVVGNSSPGDLSIKLGAANPVSQIITLK